MRYNNQIAIYITSNQVFCEWMKHIKANYHIVKDVNM